MNPTQPNQPTPQPQPASSPSQFQKAQAWFQRLKRPQQIGVGCLGLILACVLCGVCGNLAGLGGGSSTGTSTGGNTGVVQSTQAPAATKAPTNTPKPKQWKTVHHYAGSANTQTETFSVSGQWRINWKCQKSNDFGGNFIVELYNSDGSLADLVANTTDNNSGVYNGHGDGDVYIKVDTYSENWTVDVQAYQ